MAMSVTIVSVDHVNMQDWWAGAASWSRGIFRQVDLGDLSNRAVGPAGIAPACREQMKMILFVFMLTLLPLFLKSK